MNVYVERVEKVLILTFHTAVSVDRDKTGGVSNGYDTGADQGSSKNDSGRTEQP